MVRNPPFMKPGASAVSSNAPWVERSARRLVGALVFGPLPRPLWLMLDVADVA